MTMNLVGMLPHVCTTESMIQMYEKDVQIPVCVRLYLGFEKPFDWEPIHPLLSKM